MTRAMAGLGPVIPLPAERLINTPQQPKPAADNVVHLLRDLFGNAGGSAVVLSVLTVLVVWALVQGRRVELRSLFAPIGLPDLVLVIGRRLRRGGGPESTPVDDPRLAGVERLYEVGESQQFYAAIAPNYDEGNSIRALNTHFEVIDRIEQARRAKPDLNVLDLGSGTGERVATFFGNDPRVRWTAVDSCPAMVAQFNRHLTGRPVEERPHVCTEDLNHVHVVLSGHLYDIVLLNLVLSSMPALPDFRRIAKLIAPGGQLIISDINPEYTRAHPYYKATATDGTTVALRPRPVDLLKMAAHARESGLHQEDLAPIGPADPSYSFIAVFTNTERCSATRRDGTERPA